MEFNYKCLFNTGWQRLKCPFQVLFRCPRPLNRGVRLIKVSFKVNKGNNFGTSSNVRLIEGVRLIQVSLYFLNFVCTGFFSSFRRSVPSILSFQLIQIFFGKADADTSSLVSVELIPCLRPP